MNLLIETNQKVIIWTAYLIVLCRCSGIFYQEFDHYESNQRQHQSRQEHAVISPELDQAATDGWRKQKEWPVRVLDIPM